MLGGAELWFYKTITRITGDRFTKNLQNKWEEIGISTDRFHERMGNASTPRKPGVLIWLQARDVISVKPLLGLIKQLNEHEPDVGFLVTTRKQEDTNELVELLPENAVHQFLPIDLEQPARLFLKYWQPDIAIIVGGEFWPRLLTKLDAFGVPVIAVNTKMTDKSYKQWQWVSGLAKLLLNKISLILVQDQKVMKKLERLGAQTENIQVTGLITDDKNLLHYDEALYSGLSSAIGSRSVWLSAATHRDEEDVVVNAYKVALRRNRRLLLILQTREKNRSARIATRHENKNLTFVLQENGGSLDEMTDVYVTEQMENLATYLRLASVTFCGGTLSSGETIDPFHPASMGSAIIQGPACAEYQPDYERYHEGGATRLVLNGNELAQTLNEVIAPDIAASMAHAGWEISSEGGEVIGIVISEVQKMLAEGVTSYEAA
jgi:3-deoxy-D-manno-octulosonic-acid transferase